MGLYGFKQQFIPKILSGEKTHTIRSIRKHPDIPGSTMHLFFGLRTKQCKLIGRFTCTKVEEIDIWEGGVVIQGSRLAVDEEEQLARRDGFANFAEMMAFWREYNTLPFSGHIYHWSAR